MKEKPYFYAIGKRKTARATVKVFFMGSGDFLVNEKKINEWIDDREMLLDAMKPLEVLGLKKEVDIVARTSGGGKKAQADSISLGIARALSKKDSNYKTQLKEFGLLTRDSRVKERKKPGLKRARRAPQWSKR